MNADASKNLPDEQLPERKIIQRDRTALGKWLKFCDDAIALAEKEENLKVVEGLDSALLCKNMDAEILAGEIKTSVERALSVHTQIVPLVKEIIALVEPKEGVEPDMVKVNEKIEGLSRFTANAVPSHGDHNGSVSAKEHHALIHLQLGTMGIKFNQQFPTMVKLSLEALKDYLAIAENF
ncbi:MAG: hypothetical protein WCV72_00020 [Patescibacteria group bacterium]|jgi:hypothetical protein